MKRKPNTELNADIVITRNIINWSVWWKDHVIAHVNHEEGLDLIVYSAAHKGMSVFDAECNIWLAGTLDQLDPMQEVS